MRRQAFINAGIKFILEVEKTKGKFEKSEFYYETGVADYIAEHGIDTVLVNYSVDNFTSDSNIFLLGR